MACCNLPLGAHWPVVILVLAMNALGASSPAVSRRPTPQTDVPVWAVLLSHFPGQTVYKLADQPLVLAWRLDLDAVQAEMQRSGMDDGVRADDLEFGLVVDGPPPPLPRTNRTSLVPPLVLSGHAASLAGTARSPARSRRASCTFHRLLLRSSSTAARSSAHARGNVCAWHWQATNSTVVPFVDNAGRPHTAQLILSRYVPILPSWPPAAPSEASASVGPVWACAKPPFSAASSV